MIIFLADTATAFAGGKRRKVLKSFYSEKGEEISEWIWEDNEGQAEEDPTGALDAEDATPALVMDVGVGAKSKEPGSPAPHAGKASGEAAKKPAIKKPSGAAAAKANSKVQSSVCCCDVQICVRQYSCKAPRVDMSICDVWALTTNILCRGKQLLSGNEEL